MVAFTSGGVFIDTGVRTPDFVSVAFGTNGCAVIAAQLSCGVLPAESVAGAEFIVLVLDEEGIRASMGLDIFEEANIAGFSEGTLINGTFNFIDEISC